MPSTWIIAIIAVAFAVSMHLLQRAKLRKLKKEEDAEAAKAAVLSKDNKYGA